MQHKTAGSTDATCLLPALQAQGLSSSPTFLGLGCPVWEMGPCVCTSLTGMPRAEQGHSFQVPTGHSGDRGCPTGLSFALMACCPLLRPQKPWEQVGVPGAQTLTPTPLEKCWPTLSKDTWVGQGCAIETTGQEFLLNQGGRLFITPRPYTSEGAVETGKPAFQGEARAGRLSDK